jgi:hypothetical protein
MHQSSKFLTDRKNTSADFTQHTAALSVTTRPTQGVSSVRCRDMPHDQGTGKRTEEKACPLRVAGDKRNPKAHH